MTRRSRLALIVGASLLGILIVLTAALILVARSGWLREKVRERIVQEAERATGGRVEIGSFDFDWSTLRAQVNGLVIHGSEPGGSPPLVRVKSITVVLRIISFLERLADVRSVDLDQPQISLLIYPDGHTNVPEPRRKSRKGPVETILDLAVGRFAITDGSYQVNSQITPWTAAGENLRARFNYNRRRREYSGDLSIQPLNLKLNQEQTIDANIQAALAIDRNKITVSRATLATPKSTADFSGAIENFASPSASFHYDVRLDLVDLSSALPLGGRQEGILAAVGNGQFRDWKHYLLSGTVRGGPLAISRGAIRIHDVRAESTFHADPDKIELNGIRMTALGGKFDGRLRIDKLDRFRLEGNATGIDVTHAAASYGRQALPWDALVSGPIEMNGRLTELTHGRFELRARVTLAPAPVTVPLSGLIDATYDGIRGTLDMAQSFIELPSTRVEFTGRMDREMHVRLRSGDLDELTPALRMFSTNPVSLPVKLENGSALLTATLTGKLSDPQIEGHIALASFVYSGEKIDSFSADVSARKSALRVINAHVAKDKLRAQFAASVPLHEWKPDELGTISVSAALREAQLEDVLSLTGPKNVPVSGVLAGTAQMTGSIRAPIVKADFTLTKGSLYGEPFDSLTAKIDYTRNLANIARAQLIAGSNQLTLSGAYTHNPADFRNGRLDFQIASNRIAAGRLQFVQQHAPQFTGAIQLNAKGSAAVSESPATYMAFRITSLIGDLRASSVALGGKPVGDLSVKASTEGGTLAVRLEGTAAKSTVHGEGRWRMAGDFPGTADLTFSKLDLATFLGWTPRPPSPFQLAGSLQGKVTISGPALHPEDWNGFLEIPSFEIRPARPLPGENTQTAALHNDGPIRLALAKSSIRVENARLIGQGTNLGITGTVALKEKMPLDLRVNGTIDLGVLETLDSDLASSGKITADANIRGSLTQPLVTGRMDLKDVNLSYGQLPNGLNDVNGVILFTGDRATIQNLSGESGGGKVALTGFVSYAGSELAFQIKLDATQMRVRYPEGVSTVADAQLTWSGTAQRSLVSGNITILRTAFNPRTDFGAILAQSAAPVRTPAARTGLLGGTQFDVAITTSPDATFQSALAQQLQAEATLRLRGSPSNPVLLGRINITKGELTFFGTKYTISQGSISFYNPVKLEPIVNVDLQTRSRGVDVTLTVSGPMNKLNVSYRSDPPMQFSDIVALLATGRSPSNDPTMAARVSGAAQSWQQMGPSALVGQALANPVAGRLQRFFGVSQIKIDPLMAGINSNPQARLTLQQQVTPDITFTYTTNLAQSNPQVIQIEWDISKEWSAVALREESGVFGMDFYYKKRFK
ncbi:MAG TPA: translocation/assembly module TamB domain-containing protein [Bryobacteraceae bacterium]|nr:translocation/assembly module TamB domain-containing protein [Bryobacteraceae bacterium]